MDFVDENLSEIIRVKPLPLEETPFKLVEEVKDLEDLAATLQSVEEFAVNFLPLIVFSLMCNAFLECDSYWWRLLEVCLCNENENSDYTKLSLKYLCLQYIK